MAKMLLYLLMHCESLGMETRPERTCGKVALFFSKSSFSSGEKKSPQTAARAGEFGTVPRFSTFLFAPLLFASRCFSVRLLVSPGFSGIILVSLYFTELLLVSLGNSQLFLVPLGLS